MKKKKHGKKHRKAWKIVVAILAVIVVLILGVVAFAWSKFQKMDKIELKNVKVNKLQPETEKALKGYTTIALFGLDNRSN